MKKLLSKLEENIGIDDVEVEVLPPDTSEGTGIIHEIEVITDSISTAMAFRDNIREFGVHENTISLMKNLGIEKAIHLCNRSSIAIESMTDIEASLENVITKGIKWFIDQVVKFVKWIGGLIGKFFKFIKSFFTKNKNDIKVTKQAVVVKEAIKETVKKSQSSADNLDKDIDELAKLIDEAISDTQKTNSNFGKIIIPKYKHIKNEITIAKKLPKEEAIEKIQELAKEEAVEQIEILDPTNLFDFSNNYYHITTVFYNASSVISDFFDVLKNDNKEFKYDETDEKFILKILQKDKKTSTRFSVGEYTKEFIDFATKTLNTTEKKSIDVTPKSFISILNKYNSIVSRISDPAYVNSIEKEYNYIIKKEEELVEIFKNNRESISDILKDSLPHIQEYVQKVMTLQKTFVEITPKILAHVNSQIEILQKSTVDNL